jgi:hypothetical protein
VSNSAWMVNPVLVVVLPIRFTITSWLVSGFPRQFAVIWQNILYFNDFNACGATQSDRQTGGRSRHAGGPAQGRAASC